MEATDDGATAGSNGDRLTEQETPRVPAADPQWVGLLQYLHTARSFDFQSYKPASLTRRVRKRTHALGIASYEAYQEYVELHQDEFRELFNTILINVTGFFRDPDAWEALRKTAITQLLTAKGADAPVRVWSAGCASGEEAYSLAMVLAEQMGVDQFRERVKFYGTDVDEDALNLARHAAYEERQLENVPEEIQEKYFEQVDGLYAFRKDLRRQVIFGRHDLITHAPISRVDLLTCRNTLMYFNAETQARILGRFHFALSDGGYLFLGRAETLMAHGQMFVPVDLKRRISRTRPRISPREPFLVPHLPVGGMESVEGQAYLLAAALEVSPVAQMVLDAEGRVVMLNERTRSLFSLHETDIGRPLRDLQLSYRPIELRSVIDRAEGEHRTVAVKEVEWRTPGGDVRWLDVTVVPLLAADRRAQGMLVTFSDMTTHRRLQRELEQSHMELETAYEELQSTNEELETMNEELQSTNEELETINYEVRLRSDDLDNANRFLESVLTSLRSGVVVVDRELRLLAWSRHAEELWGVRAQEVSGQHLLNLDIGLSLQRLRPALKTCLNGESAQEQMVVDAVNRRGKKIVCQVGCSPLSGADGTVAGVIIVMDEVNDGHTPGQTDS